MTREWSTLRTPPGRRFAYWRELICEAFLDLTPESDLRDDFTGVVRQWGLGRLDLARIDSQRQLVRRTRTDIEHAPRSGYYANLQVRGQSATAQDGRTALLRPGDLTLVDTGRPFTMDFPADFRQVSFFIPRSLLEAQLPSGVRTATRIATSAGVGAAVKQTLAALTCADFRAATAERLALSAVGLIAVALDEPVPAPRGQRSARTYAAALADIEEHLTDDDLSPATTAKRLGLSVRTLHGLFAGHERTYTAAVRRLRLEQARHDLQDPAYAHLRVIDVAADAGFADISSFHRAFRREFGHTPAQIRNRP